MSVCVFTYGVGVVEDQALPWGGYTRTLSVGPVPRLIGRLLNGLAFAVIGLVTLVLLAWLLTAATLPPSRLALRRTHAHVPVHDQSPVADPLAALR